MSLDTYKKEIEDAYTDGEDQRDMANEEIRFVNVPGGMWENFAEATHNSNTNRSRMEFDIVSDYVNRFIGEYSLNRMNVTFTPDDDATTDDDAELINGLYRADFKDNDGQTSQDNAVGEVAECGYGAFRISTRFEDEEDPENENQEVFFSPVFNAYSTVIWDGNAKRVDKADARWGAVLTSYTPEAFEIAFPNADPVDAMTPNSRKSLDWNTSELIYVAEYYRVEKKKETVHVYRNVSQGLTKAYSQDEVGKIEDELKEEGWEFVRKRTMMTRKVLKSVFNGDEFMTEGGEKQEDILIPGKFIPIIPMYGFRRYVDGKERYRGLVRKLMDAARLFNMNLSRMAEAAASSPDSLPIYTEKQVEGRETALARHGDAYKVINDMEDAQGNPIATGPIDYTRPTQLDPNTVASTEVVSNYAQRVTGGAPQEIENTDASGKAITALRQRENLNTQVVKDNIITSIKHSGVVYRSIQSEISTSQRSRSSLAEDGTRSTVQINTTILDGETGDIVIGNDLTKGKFKVDVEVGPQYETQREATVDTLEKVLDILGPENEFFRPALIMYLKNITGTGLGDFQEFVRQSALRLGLEKPVTDGDRAIVQQAQQQTDPNEELQKSVARQQEAEAESLIASSEQKRADAGKKKVETLQIAQEIGLNVNNDFLQRRQAQLN